ncbi:MAG: HDIG domain-containing protein [Candidatus Altiarchaeota archaeon]|nr:HDIG domain-containing protein [Candidatus Altiarchaeota archaeon]
MPERISRREALKILEENNCQKNVLTHCKTVAREAKKMAVKLRKKGVPVDVEFVETAALLHDIGRCRTHGILHGIEGAKIMKDYPDYARVCERHIGAVITKYEAKELGMPERDFLPETLEEKIIAHADNIVGECKVEGIEKTIESVGSKLGMKHPAVKRIMELDAEIKRLMG